MPVGIVAARPPCAAYGSVRYPDSVLPKRLSGSTPSKLLAIPSFPHRTLLYILTVNLDNYHAGLSGQLVQFLSRLVAKGPNPFASKEKVIRIKTLRITFIDAVDPENNPLDLAKESSHFQSSSERASFHSRHFHLNVHNHLHQAIWRLTHYLTSKNVPLDRKLATSIISIDIFINDTRCIRLRSYESRGISRFKVTYMREEMPSISEHMRMLRYGLRLRIRD